MARKFINNFWILDFHASLTIEKVLRPQYRSITNSIMSPKCLKNLYWYGLLVATIQDLVCEVMVYYCFSVIPRRLFSYSSLYSRGFAVIVYAKSWDISS